MELLKAFVAGAAGGLLPIVGGLLLWKLNAKQNLRMAVFEKRFQAHQEAFSQVVMITDNLIYKNREKLRNCSDELSNWYLNNNLYLDAGPSQAVAHVARDQTEWRPDDFKKGIVKELDEQEKIDHCIEALQEITLAVNLPAIQEPYILRHIKGKSLEKS